MFSDAYHGHSDHTLAIAKFVNGVRQTIPWVPGVPQSVVGEVLVLPYGDPNSLEVIRAHLHELAVVLVEALAVIGERAPPHEVAQPEADLAEPVGIGQRLARRRDEVRQRLAKPLRISLRQVDGVLDTVKCEGHGLVGFSAVEVVDELDDGLLCHCSSVGYSHSTRILDVTTCSGNTIVQMRKNGEPFAAKM